MDVDRFISLHRPVWDRLAHLSARGRRPRRLTPSELDELVHLYQRVSGHLSSARATFDDPVLEATLTNLVADANACIYGSRASARAALSRIVFRTFPGAVWRIRRAILAAALLLLVPALAVGSWISTSDAALDASAPEAARAAYVSEEFEDYYSSAPASQFATEVTINNIQVSILAFALGITACVGTAFVLAFNGANVGLAGGLFHAVGEAPRFWGLILPHGLLELTAVVIAGGAGLHLGWALIAPGDRTRARAVAEEGRRVMPVVLGLIVAFVTAGLVEGFVTGSGLPTPLRIGVGVLVETAFIAYLWRFGRSEVAEAAALEAGLSTR